MSARRREWACSTASARSALLSGGVLAASVLVLGTTVQDAREDQSLPARYGAIDVFVDSGATPLAAYQFELSARKGTIQIVGVEGGEQNTAFATPPYYDPAALQNERIVIAAFNTGIASALPTGKTRVARVHLRITGDAAPEYEIRLQVASDRDGKSIDAIASVEDTTQEGGVR